MAPTHYQIPYLITSSIAAETETYLKSLGLIDDGGKGAKSSETLAAEFYFPIFSPRGIFAVIVSHLGQVMKIIETTENKLELHFLMRAIVQSFQNFDSDRRC